MKTTVHLVYLFLLLCAFGFAQDAAQVSATQVVVPRLIRFSGTVKEPVGATTVGITFTLHKSQQDSTALWLETQNVQLDPSGKYTVLLGATKAEGIPVEMFTSGEAQWLGIQVENQPEQPRLLLVSVPYALRAAEADTLAGHAATEFVTADKLKSAVQQQLEQPTVAKTSSGGKQPVKASPPTTDPATNFSDNNASEVVLVTQSGTGTGLWATTAGYSGLVGVSSSPTGKGAYGYTTSSTGVNTGLLGVSASTSGTGAQGIASAATGATVGIAGTSASSGGIGMKATASSTTGATIGLVAQSRSATGVGAVFQNLAGGKLLSAETGSSETEVFSIAGTGSVTATSSAPGVASPSATNLAAAVFAHETNATGFTNGVAGIVDATSGSGVIGIATASSTGSDSPSGVAGIALATSGYTYGVTGEVSSANGISGDFRNDVSGTVLRARYGKPSATTVLSVGSTGFQIGVAGQNGTINGNTVVNGNTNVNGNTTLNGSATVVSNLTVNGTLSAASTLNVSGSTTLNGSATVDGNLNVTGTLSAGTKEFKIDDPLDPADKYLYHASVESSEMMNIYSGNATTDAAGRAVVQLPDWFEAENRDFRYQLTVLEQFAQAIVAKKISDHQFTIKTDKPNVEVSWLVTGVRQDAYAKAHPLEVEVDKSEREKGHYIHPELYGAAPEKQIDGHGNRN
jgi:hypothetical protein